MDRSVMGIGEGRTVSHYRIVSRIGAGGMGLVYKCLDLRLNRPVALKFLPPELTLDESAKHRFVREAQAASALDHPNICSIHDIDETPDGQLFICMAYYEGETLDKRLGKGPLPVREALQIAARVADGLARAHDHEIIHRDVKPDNIMLTRDGEVKILDFGLAKLKGSSRITRKGATVGTCAYMSPEQTLGDDVDARSDVFSLGVVLYQLLTDQAPFKADFPDAVMYQIVHNEPRPLTDLRPEVSAALRRVVEKAMRKNPADRYQSMSDMRDDLLALTGDTIPFWKKIPRPYRRLAVTLAAVATVAGLTAVIPQARNGIARLFPGMPDRIHIAVLPFENVGKDPQNQAFCDGLTETLSAQLSQLERLRDALWVVPATEVRAAGVSSPMEARKRLGVNLVVTGAVQRLGDRFRVTLSLVDPVAKGAPRQLEAAMIDNVMERVATLQDEAVMRMAGMMDLELRPQEENALTAGGTSVSTAYDFYLQGIGYVRSFEITGHIDRAVDAFSMAIDRDSLYALAYAGLGEA